MLTNIYNGEDEGNGGSFHPCMFASKFDRFPFQKLLLIVYSQLKRINNWAIKEIRATARCQDFSNTLLFETNANE